MPSAAIGGVGASVVSSGVMTAMDIDNGISMEGVVMGAGSLLAGRALLNAMGESSLFFKLQSS